MRLFALPRTVLALALFASCVPFAGAQEGGVKRLEPVSVGISFPAKSYVLGEAIPVRLLVRNNTPRELVLGQGDTPAGVFSVSRVADPRHILPRNAGGCLPRPLVLKPGEERTFDVDLSKESALHDQGQYFVTFGVVTGGVRHDTQMKMIEIVPGFVVAEGVQLFARDAKRQRHLTLVRWPRDHVDRLFLRISDSPDGQTFPTVMLGAYLPLVKPRLNIASSGEITILHRATPDYYVRNVFWSLPGEFVRRSTQSLLDPATADTARLKGMQGDLNEVIQKNERLKEAVRLR